MAEDIVSGQPPVGLQFEFDPDRRIARVTFRENVFTINPPSVEIPFAYLKESTAQVLEFEAQMKISMLPPGTKPKNYPPGLRGKLRCAEIIMLEAKSEIAGDSLVGKSVGEDEAEKEAERIKKNLELVT
jgi:hypothetical protein